MATNKVNDGDVLDIVAPYAVVSGRIVVVGQMAGVALANAAINANVALATRGTFNFTKAAGASTLIAAGGNVYWDNTNNQVTNSATSNTRIGVATLAVANAATVVPTRLLGPF